MSRIVTVDLKKMSPKYTQRTNVLVSGVCKSLLPMNVLRSRRYVKGVFHIAGYQRLAELSDVGAEEILTLLRKILEGVSCCEDYLIFPDEFLLTSETIYVSEDRQRVKFSYIPADTAHSEDHILHYLIHGLKQITTENGRMYLDTLETMMQCRHLKRERIIGFIEELKGEVRVCGIR